MTNFESVKVQEIFGQGVKKSLFSNEKITSLGMI